MTIVIMGIIFAIATSSWQGVVERRAIDSATNQFAVDLRLAHSSATNQLTDYVVAQDHSDLASGLLGTGTCPGGTAPDYYMIKINNTTPVSYEVTPRCFDGDRARVNTAFGVRFDVDGSAVMLGSYPERFAVGTSDGNPSHTIEVKTTSRVQIDPNP